MCETLLDVVQASDGNLLEWQEDIKCMKCRSKVMFEYLVLSQSSCFCFTIHNLIDFYLFYLLCFITGKMCVGFTCVHLSIHIRCRRIVQ